MGQQTETLEPTERDTGANRERYSETDRKKDYREKH